MNINNDLVQSNYLLKYLSITNTSSEDKDLNNYRSLGIYSIENPKNYYHSDPIWCTVLCIPTNYNKKFVLQIAYSTKYTNELCARVCDNDEWKSWKTL